MEPSNPLQPGNLNNTGATNTTKFFNNFFTPDYAVSSNTNDAIVSYFEQQTGSLDSAKLLAQTVINTAQAQREDPLVILSEFQKLPNDQVNAILTLYLNSTRVNTSLLAIKNKPRPNPFITRTILV
jgi:hypothetical protein